MSIQMLLTAIFGGLSHWIVNPSGSPELACQHNLDFLAQGIKFYMDIWLWIVVTLTCVPWLNCILHTVSFRIIGNPGKGSHPLNDTKLCMLYVINQTTGIKIATRLKMPLSFSQSSPKGANNSEYMCAIFLLSLHNLF